MDPSDRQTTEEALKKLLEFSLLIPLEDKQKIVQALSSFSDDEVMGLGKILAAEHRNREILDQEMVQDMIDALMTKINS